MALFGLRGGQPFYPMYQASKMPEMQMPQGLYTYISLNTPKQTTSKSKTKEEQDKETEASLYPGTAGVRRQINEQSGMMQQQYNNVVSYVQNEATKWFREGKDPNEFMQRQDIQEKVNVAQNIVHYNEQLGSLKPDANEDNVNIADAETRTLTKGDIVTKDMGGFEMPMYWTGDEKHPGGPGNFEEFYDNERTRNKIYPDKNGNLQYSKMDRPAMLNTSGKFDEYARGIFTDAASRISTWEDVLQQGFNPSGENAMVYGMNIGGSSNVAAVNAAALTLENQLTPEARVDADRSWWRDYRDGTAKVYDPDKKGFRTMTIEERQKIDDYHKGKLKEEQRREVLGFIDNSLRINRLRMITERRDDYLQYGSKKSFGPRLYDEGEANAKQTGGFLFNLMQGKQRPDAINDKRFGAIMTNSNGDKINIMGNNLVWNALNQKDVKDENERLRTSFTSGDPDIVSDFGVGAIKLNRGGMINANKFASLRVMGTTGTFHTSYNNENLKVSANGYVYDPNNKQSVELVTQIERHIQVAQSYVKQAKNSKTEEERKENLEHAKNVYSRAATFTDDLRKTTPVSYYQQYEIVGDSKEFKNAFNGQMVRDQNGKMVDLGDIVSTTDNWDNLSASEKEYIQWFGFRKGTIAGATEGERNETIIFDGNFEVNQTKMTEGTLSYPDILQRIQLISNEAAYKD